MTETLLGSTPSPDVASRLTHDEVKRFLAAKKASFRCPACHAMEWTLMEEDEARGFPLRAQKATGELGSKTFPVLAMVCTNCSTVWMLARRLVEEWLLENRS